MRCIKYIKDYKQIQQDINNLEDYLESDSDYVKDMYSDYDRCHMIIEREVYYEFIQRLQKTLLDYEECKQKWSDYNEDR